MRSWFYCLLLLIFIQSQCHAQIGNQQLKTVTKTTSRELFLPSNNGVKEWEMDSARRAIYKGQSLATLLSQQLPVFIKTYGTNGLATLSLRGASAAQTAVQWNGVPLQSGATGLVDLMLIPAFVVNGVRVEYGSNGGRVGNGAVGGVLTLTSDVGLNRNASSQEAFLGMGSFGRWQGGVRMQEQHTKWGLSVAATGVQATNSFSYTDNSGRERKLDNAVFKSGNVMMSGAYKLPCKRYVSGSVWYNRASREIPPALFEAYSVKHQEDEALRTLITYVHEYKPARNFSVQASLIDEWFRYVDTASLTRSRLHSRQLFVKPSLSRSMQGGRLTLQIAVPVQYNYLLENPGKKIVKTALMADMKSYYGKKDFGLDARAEMINGKLFGAGGLNGSIMLTNRIRVRGSVGYAYRNPTLNELYYTPGGNPDLLPEQGFAADAGYHSVLIATHHFSLTHDATMFYRNMENWILWFGGAIWTPHNIARVASKGFETENYFRYKRPKTLWVLRLSGSYTSSQTIESIVPGDASINRQIPYVPKVIGQANLSVNTKRLRLGYNHTYTGIRYFNTDETGEIPAFSTGNLQAGYLLQRGHWTYDFSLQIQNIWNNRYAEVAFRPAPGINWLAGVSLSHNK